MRIKFVNAFNGNEEFGGKFFKTFAKLALVDIRVAQATGGAKEVAKVLDNDNFLGKVKEIKEYSEPSEKVSYIIFTMPVSKIEPRFDEKTGKFLKEVEVTEDYTYYLEVRSNI